jgi:hypothetical protein
MDLMAFSDMANSRNHRSAELPNDVSRTMS